jgi:deoxycytidylate deaminase
MSIRIATKVASESVFHRARVGAVIAKGERILSTGHNYLGFSRLLPNRPYKESIHAEQSAILKLLKARRLNDLVGASIYIVRIGGTGLHRLARPCRNCADLIRNVGISEVVYTTNDGVSSYCV